MDLIDPITVVDEEEDDNLEFEKGTVEFVENDDESNGDGGGIVVANAMSSPLSPNSTPLSNALLPQSSHLESAVAIIPVEITEENAHYYLPAS